MTRILIGCPSSGTLSEGTAQASYQGSLRHKVDRVKSCHSGPNFNACWRVALNAGMRREYTHFAMLHADVEIEEDECSPPEPWSVEELWHLDRYPCFRGVSPDSDLHLSIMADHAEEHGLPQAAECYRARVADLRGRRLWLDRLVEDMEAAQVDFLSVPVAIKDERGMVSCGIGDPNDMWVIWRRFCTNELPLLPEVFTADQIGYGDKYLLHNHAVCLWDLRSPLWYIPKKDTGGAPAVFNYAEDIRLVNGKWELFGQSEDWAYSRLLWRIGARTAISRRIKVNHVIGNVRFPNTGDWGTLKNGDEELAWKWRATDPIRRNQP